MKIQRKITSLLVIASLLSLPSMSLASSHREAPAITKHPQVDGTDFYMFRSYEDGRQDYVTFIANYNPLQDPYGGPNYFPLDTSAVYDIHVTNSGDVNEEITYRFQFQQKSPFIALNIGDPTKGQEKVTIPLSNAGPVTAGDESNMNVFRSYTVELIRGKATVFPNERRDRTFLQDAKTGSKEFRMPFDNIGKKSFPDYEAYAKQFMYDVTIPGCAQTGRVFVGQRKDPFAVNLGEVFDLVNVTNPLGAPDVEESVTDDKNITALELEIPIACLIATSGNPIIGAWTKAALPRINLFRDAPTYNNNLQQQGPFTQVSRLANPLVNEVAIGLDKKDLFNASHPNKDTQFLKFVTHPTLPALLEILFGAAGVKAPTNFPRQDLVAVFLTGIQGLNMDGSVGEVMRLNTGILPMPRDNQSNLGALTGDMAGYPNGRRPGDDVVDISLRAVMGILCHTPLGLCTPGDAASGLLPFTDGAPQNAQMFDDKFPYLITPIAGSPNSTP